MEPVAGGVYVLPFFPHREDSSSGEARWVILLEDFISSVLVVPLTTQLHQLKNYKKSFIIKKDSDEGKKMGLTDDSIVIIERVQEMSPFVLSKSKLRGNCPEEILDKIQVLITKN